MISGIRTASYVPIAWREMEEESAIYQRVMSGAPDLIDKDVAAFCSRERNEL
jgi:hypothetical protein